MKHFYLLIFTLLFTRAVQAQQNLVPNPSFEDTSYCNMACFSNFGQVSDWFTAANTPDFVNVQCSLCPAPNFIGPNWAYQYAHSGTNYIRLHMQYYPTTIQYFYREIVGCELKDDLIKGKRYLVSFYYNTYLNINETPSNDQGILFSTKKHDFAAGDSTFYYGNNPHFAHVSADSINRDTLNWTHFQKYFIADSAYRYLYLGNFYEIAHTQKDTPIRALSSYYFDDVSVVLDNTYLSIDTKKNSHLINVYPNPANDLITVESTFDTNFTTFKIYSITGFLVKQVQGESLHSVDLDVSDLNSGYYFVRINFLNGLVVNKYFLKN